MVQIYDGYCDMRYFEMISIFCIGWIKDAFIIEFTLEHMEIIIISVIFNIRWFMAFIILLIYIIVIINFL